MQGSGPVDYVRPAGAVPHCGRVGPGVQLWSHRPHGRELSGPSLAGGAAVRPFFYPSNSGPWSNDLGYFITALITEIRSFLTTLCFFVVFNRRHLYDSQMVGGALVNEISGAAAPQEGLHGPSARYLIGALSSIALEGLFAKSSFVMQV